MCRGGGALIQTPADACRPARAGIQSASHGNYLDSSSCPGPGRRVRSTTGQINSTALRQQRRTCRRVLQVQQNRTDLKILSRETGKEASGKVSSETTGPPCVSGCQVRPRRQNAGARRKRRQDRQRQLVRGLLCGGVPRRRDSPVPTSPQNNESRTIEHGASSARSNGVRSVASECSELRP